MTTIKATCPVCGDVDLTPRQLRLVVASQPGLSFYSFRCATCRDEIRKPADEEVVALLTSGGVVAERWEVPAEALETRTGPVIGYDDVLDFALALERVDRLVAILAPRVGA